MIPSNKNGGYMKVYYYWILDEKENIIKLQYTKGSIPVDPNLTKDTKTYTSIADAMYNAPKFAEVIHV